MGLVAILSAHGNTLVQQSSRGATTNASVIQRKLLKEAGHVSAMRGQKNREKEGKT